MKHVAGLLLLFVVVTGQSNAADHPPTADVVVMRDGTETVATSDTGQQVSRSTDAAAVLQAAIDHLPQTGGKITIRAGQYLLDRTVSIRNRHAVHLEGAARGMQAADQGGTVLYAETPIHLLEVYGRDFRVFGITISNLFLFGSGKDNGHAGLVVRGTTDVLTLQNVGAGNHGTGFWLKGRDQGKSGSGVNDATQIIACDPQRNGTGLLIESAHYTKILGGEFSDNLEYGIHLQALVPGSQRVQGVKIIGVTAVRNDKAGILVADNVEDTSISGGTDVGASKHGDGIVIDRLADGIAPRQTIVSGVHLYNHAGSGIHIGSASLVNISGNIISEHDHHAGRPRGQRSGVYIAEGASSILVSDNIISLHGPDAENRAIMDESGEATTSGNLIRTSHDRKKPKKGKKEQDK